MASSNTPVSIPSARHIPGTGRQLPFVALLLLLAVPLLGGCLERSTTVGDRYSGTVILATTPDNPRGAPQLDLPESMASRIAVSEYSQTPESDAPDEDGAPAGEDAAPELVGTQARFSELTAGQFGQLGDIVAEAFGDTSVTMDLDAQRSGEVVRLRGGTDLTDLAPGQDYVRLSVTFGGPVTATNGEQTGQSTVTWTPEPGKPTDFSADATYPDPATAALSSWSWFLALVCLAVVVIVVWLAYLRRYRGPRPGRPGGVPTSTASAD